MISERYLLLIFPASLAIFDLVRFRPSCFSLEIKNFFHSVTGEDVVTSPGALIESQVREHWSVWGNREK